MFHNQKLRGNRDANAFSLQNTASRRKDYKNKKQASSPANDFLTLGPLDGIIEFDDLLNLRLKFDIPAEVAGVLVNGCRLVRKRALIHGDIGILGNWELIVNRKLDRTGSEILHRNLIPSVFDLSSVQQSGFRSLIYHFLPLSLDRIVFPGIEVKIGA